jgi:hypothetical protein
VSEAALPLGQWSLEDNNARPKSKHTLRKTSSPINC